jgi:hypothetical protein
MEARRARHKPSDTGKAKKPYQPAIGRDFDVEELEANTRGFIVRITVPAAVIGLAISGIYSLVTRNSMVVLGVWSAVGPIIGAILGHYFGPRRDTE